MRLELRSAPLAAALLPALAWAAACTDEPTGPPAEPDPAGVLLVFPADTVAASATAVEGGLSLRVDEVSDPFDVVFVDAAGEALPPAPGDFIELAFSGTGAVARGFGNDVNTLLGVEAGQVAMEVSLVRPGGGDPRVRFRSAPVPVTVAPAAAAVRLVVGEAAVTATEAGADGALAITAGTGDALEVTLRDDGGAPLELLDGERLEVALRGAGAATLEEEGGGWRVRGVRPGRDTLVVRLLRDEGERVAFAPVPVEVAPDACEGPTGGGLCLRLIRSDLDHPVHMTAPPGDARLFLARSVGVIDILHPDGRTTRFLDVIDLVRFGDEQGLLGLAFHPDYASNGTFFIYYKTKDAHMQLDRLTVGPDPDRADQASREAVLTVPHDPTLEGLHNAGHILFGPDGHLWVTAGDGGAANEDDVSIDSSDLRGSILRIDVAPAPAPAGYTVPAGNPFVSGPEGARPEIYMYGLRNPWRIEIDPAERLLYVADVGENRREELNVVSLDAAGANFGWDALEGTYCRRSDCSAVLDTTVLPVLEYPHPDGAAIIGGHLYGGTIPALQGRYLFGDFLGFIRSVRMTAGQPSDLREHFANGALSEPGGRPGLISAFARDRDGELYVLVHDGRIYRIEADPAAGGAPPPRAADARGIGHRPAVRSATAPSARAGSGPPPGSP